MTACLLAMGASGKRHVVAVRPLYGGTDHLLDNGLLGVEVTWAGPKEIEHALRPDTGLVIVETPANPTLGLLDLDDVCAQAGAVPVLVDNTLLPPRFCSNRCGTVRLWFCAAPRSSSVATEM